MRARISQASVPASPAGFPVAGGSVGAGGAGVGPPCGEGVSPGVAAGAGRDGAGTGSGSRGSMASSGPGSGAAAVGDGTTVWETVGSGDAPGVPSGVTCADAPEPRK